MAKTKLTTAQRVAQRQRAKETQGKKVPTHKRLGVRRAGRYGDTYTTDLKPHSWLRYIYRMGNVAGEAETIEEIQYRRKQIRYASSLAIAARRKAERQEQAEPGSGSRALYLDLDKVERARARSLYAADRQEQKLLVAAKKKKATRKKAVKKTTKKPKKKAKRKKKATKKPKKRKKKKKGAKK
jgi:hypothetical protein